MIKYDLQVVSYELLVGKWKLKSTCWNSKVRVKIYGLRVQIHNLQVQIHDSLRVTISEAWIRKLKAQVARKNVQVGKLKAVVEAPHHDLNSKRIN